MPDKQKIKRKPISNCYVFAKVMENDKDLCRLFATWVTGQHIGKIKKIVAEAVENTVLTRSVRFDAYLEGEDALVDIEMQVLRDPNLAVRIAHYMSWMTTHALDKGDKIEHMPKRYVIFVCTYDPIGDADPLYKIQSYSKGTHLRLWDNGECAFILNTKGELSRTVPRIAEVLKYIDTGEVNVDNEVITRMCDGIDKAYEQEDWVSDMNGTDFDHLAWKAEGREEGRATGLAEGKSAERKREAALLQAMSAHGCSLEEAVTLFTNGDLDTLYREYGIECE